MKSNRKTKQANNNNKNKKNNKKHAYINPFVPRKINFLKFLQNLHIICVLVFLEQIWCQKSIFFVFQFKL